MKHFIALSLFVIMTNCIVYGGEPLIRTAGTKDAGLVITSKSTTSFEGINRIPDISFFKVKTEQGTFIQLMASGYAFSSTIGDPQLPILKNLIEIPYGSEVRVIIQNFEVETYKLSDFGIFDKIMPLQPSLQKGKNPTPGDFHMNKTTYLQNSFGNSSLVTVDILGTMRGVQLGRINISPIQYNPVTNELKIYHNIQFEVFFDNADLQTTAEMRQKYYSPAFEKNFSKMLNYNSSCNKDVITTYPMKYVIVADPMFQSQLQPFIEWKTKKGFIVVEAYTNNPSVGTTTTSIQTYLADQYNNATPTDPAPTFILFVGDVAQIPVFTGSAGSHVTDLYYCTYDGGTDFYPDVYYGRFTAENSSHLQPQIDKTLEYEQYLFPDETFLNDVVLVSGVDASMAATYGNGQINYGTDNYFNTAHGITDYTWLYPASIGASSSIRSRVSLGCSFLNYTAHCGPSGWGDPSFTVTDVANLTNAHKYPLSVGNCCSSNEFQESVCFGEALMRGETKGAIGHIGGSNSTYWSEDYWWGVGNAPISANPTYAGSGLGAYDCLFHDHGEGYSDWFITSDQILHSGNLAVTEAGSSLETYYWEIYHLMGDPSLMPYLSVPPALTATYLNPVPIGTTTLEVITEPHSYVAISENNVLLDAKYSGSGTSVILEFPVLLNPGSADIVVTKQFRKPFIDSLDIVPGNTANDAQVMSISVPTMYVNIMTPNVSPSFTIRNLGNSTLATAQTGYKIDGGTIITQAWAGSLNQYQTDVVTFPQITLTPGTHTITAFVSWPNGVEDEFHPGDTITRTFHVIAGDASLINHNQFSETYCNPDTLTPVITFSNKGNVNLLTVKVNYQIDSEPIQTIQWSGNLAYNSQETINFPQITLSPGNHTFRSFTSEPNGGTDDNPANDFKESDYSVFSYAQNVLVSILTDDYGSETTWEIVNDTTSAVLYSGGPYSDWDPQVYETQMCFGDGCYTFTIHDSWGDGQLGSSNNGTYTVTNTTISSIYGTGGGNWGSSASINFCINTTDISNSDAPVFAIYPNPSSGPLHILCPIAHGVIEITSVTGQIISTIDIFSDRTTIDMSQFPAGVYNVTLIQDGNRVSQQFVLIK